MDYNYCNKSGELVYLMIPFRVSTNSYPKCGLVSAQFYNKIVDSKPVLVRNRLITGTRSINYFRTILSQLCFVYPVLLSKKKQMIPSVLQIHDSTTRPQRATYSRPGWWRRNGRETCRVREI